MRVSLFRGGRLFTCLRCLCGMEWRNARHHSERRGASFYLVVREIDKLIADENRLQIRPVLDLRSCDRECKQRREFGDRAVSLPPLLLLRQLQRECYEYCAIMERSLILYSATAFYLLLELPLWPLESWQEELVPVADHPICRIPTRARVRRPDNINSRINLALHRVISKTIVAPNIEMVLHSNISKVLHLRSHAQVVSMDLENPAEAQTPMVPD
jgi:hypothetical protein